MAKNTFELADPLLSGGLLMVGFDAAISDLQRDQTLRELRAELTERMRGGSEHKDLVVLRACNTLVMRLQTLECDVDELNQSVNGLIRQLLETEDFDLFADGFFGVRKKFALSNESWDELMPTFLAVVEVILQSKGVGVAVQSFWRSSLARRLKNEPNYILADNYPSDPSEEVELLAPSERCEALAELGNLLIVKGRHIEAEKYLREAADEVGSIADHKLRCEIFRSLGDVLMPLGRLADAEKYLRMAVEEAEHFDAGAGHCAFVSLGFFLHQQGNDEEAQTYLRKAAEAAGNAESPPACKHASHFWAVYLAGHHNGDEAEKHLRAAALEAEQLTDRLTRCIRFMSLGEVLAKQGKLEEAEHFLGRAVDEAERLTEPLTRCNAAQALARFLFFQKRYREAIPVFQDATKELLQLLSSNRWPDGVANMAARYRPLFDNAITCCVLQLAEPCEPMSLYDRSTSLFLLRRPSEDAAWEDLGWQALGFMDALRCLSIREGLRQQVEKGAPATMCNWIPGPEDLATLFEGTVDSCAHSAPASVRRLQDTDNEAVGTSPMALELKCDGSSEKNQFTKPISRTELTKLLPDRNTVLLVFHFAPNCLYVFWIRQGEDSQPQLAWSAFYTAANEDDDSLPTAERQGPDLRGRVEILASQHRALVHCITETGCYEDSAAIRAFSDSEKAAGGATDSVFSMLGAELRLDVCLTMIEPDPRRWRDLHLILVPDGPLFRLPLHAARAGEKPLIDQVGSVRYALSLRTLELQQRIEDERSRLEHEVVALRGVAFVNPSGPRQQQARLDQAETELRNLAIGNPNGWRCFGERPEFPEWLASRENLRSYHSTSNVLWTVCHGGLEWDEFKTADERMVRVNNPSLLLYDGPMSMARMYAEGFDLRPLMLFHNSCCLLGELLDQHHSQQVEGYISTLTLLGCRRVCSAMWELADHAAAEFAKHWQAALLKHAFRPGPRGPHAFAVAFKDAIMAFRNTGRFDHEYFWAPYTLFGLG